MSFRSFVRKFPVVVDWASAKPWSEQHTTSSENNIRFMVVPFPLD
jgi:hypothetical protein